MIKKRLIFNAALFLSLLLNAPAPAGSQDGSAIYSPTNTEPAEFLGGLISQASVTSVQKGF
jgi:hypothetical protein